MASLSVSIAQGCDATGGVFTLSQADPAPGAGPNLTYSWKVLDASGVDYGGPFDPSVLPVTASGLPDGTVTLRVMAVDTDGSSSYFSQLFTRTVDCGGGSPTEPGALMLDSLSHTDETASLDDGTATIQASGGLAPLTATVVETGATQAATSGQPVTFPGLAPSFYTLQVMDSTAPTPQVVGGQVEVLPYAEPTPGCLDEYADNYNPAATSSDNSCTYTPRWRSAWQFMEVRVPAVAGQLTGYIAAELRIGFRPGHRLADERPLGAPLKLRATVGPDGYAIFRLGPYLRPQLGAADGAGGYRLDLNSATATLGDLYVGYELRRPTGELLEHGYALNSAVPDTQLQEGTVLNPFWPLLPNWPGFEDYPVSQLYTTPLGSTYLPGTGFVQSNGLADYDTTTLPCPLNPLPVAWLAPNGGFGYWCFSGRPTLGDTAGDGQQYREASTGQQRLSDPGDSYQTYKATSGVFRGDALLTGLRTLWRSPQAWVQLVPGGEWVPIVVERGTREVGRMGVLKNEVPISFQLAAPEWAQGQ